MQAAEDKIGPLRAMGLRLMGGGLAAAALLVASASPARGQGDIATLAAQEEVAIGQSQQKVVEALAAACREGNASAGLNAFYSSLAEAAHETGSSTRASDLAQRIDGFKRDIEGKEGRLSPEASSKLKEVLAQKTQQLRDLKNKRERLSKMLEQLQTQADQWKAEHGLMAQIDQGEADAALRRKMTQALSGLGYKAPQPTTAKPARETAPPRLPPAAPADLAQTDAPRPDPARKPRWTAEGQDPRALDVMRAYIESMASNDTSDLGRLLADVVDYCYIGPRTPRKSVLNDHEKLALKYPERSYSVQSAKMARLGPSEIRAVVQFTYRYSGAGKRASGSCAVTLGLSRSAGEWRIVEINEDVKRD